MFLVYVRDGLFVSEIRRQTEKCFYLKNNIHSQFRKVLQHRVFETEEEAYEFYNWLYPVYEEHRAPIKNNLVGVEIQASFDVHKAKRELQTFDANAFDLIKTYPEDFV